MLVGSIWQTSKLGIDLGHVGHFRCLSAPHRFGRSGRIWHYRARKSA